MLRSLNIILLCLFLHISYSQTIANEGLIEMKFETKRQDDSAPTGNTEPNNNRWGDFEMKGEMFFKDGKSKMQIDMGFSNSEVYYDGDTKKTTTLFQMMGKKMGFYTTEEEVKKVMDANDSSNQFRFNPNNTDMMIEYLSDTKTIAGFACKKANIRYMNRKGEEMQQIVWYCPDFIVGERFRMSSFMRIASVPGMQKLKGFPMEYEMTRTNGMTINYVVTKVDLNKKVEDATFVIPSGYDIKPMSEFSRDGGRMFMGRGDN